MFGRSIDRIRPGRAFAARSIDRLRQAVEGLGRQPPGSGFTGFETPAGLLRRRPRREPFHARLSGSGIGSGGPAPYSFVEVYGTPNSSLWAELPGGRSGANAYALNGTMGLNAQVVELTEVAGGAWYRFNWVSSATGGGGSTGCDCSTLPDALVLTWRYRSIPAAHRLDFAWCPPNAGTGIASQSIALTRVAGTTSWQSGFVGFSEHAGVCGSTASRPYAGNMLQWWDTTNTVARYVFTCSPSSLPSVPCTFQLAIGTWPSTPSDPRCGPADYTIVRGATVPTCGPGDGQNVFGSSPFGAAISMTPFHWSTGFYTGPGQAGFEPEPDGQYFQWWDVTS